MCELILYNYCNHTILYGTPITHHGTVTAAVSFLSHLTLSLSHLTSLTAQLRKITRFYKISQKERQRERESSRIKNQLTERERESPRNGTQKPNKQHGVQRAKHSRFVQFKEKTRFRNSK